MRRTLIRTLLGVFFLTTVASAAMLLLSNRLILWWVGPQIHPPFLLLLGLAVWTVISSCGNALAMFLNGATIVRFQVITASAFGISCLLTKIIFTCHYGILGVPWATIITYLLTAALPYALYVPRLLKQIAATHDSARLNELLYGIVEE